MLRAILVDDEAVNRSLIKKLSDDSAELELLGEFDNAVAANNFLQKTEVDLLLLDVEMPGMTGIEMVRNLKHKPAVVLITSKSDYAAEAFEIEVDDFIVKPPSLARLMKAITRVKDRLNQTKEVVAESDFIFVKSNKKLVKVDYDSIVCCEATGDYVLLQLADGKHHIVYSTMSGLEEKLPSKKFLRVHRSFIVNLSQVSEVQDNVVVAGTKTIPVSNSYRSSLMERLNLL